MKLVRKNVSLLPALLGSLALIPVTPAQAQYTFSPQIQSTNTASMTYNSGADTFEYTDTNNLSADSAGLPLAGSAAACITPSNAWAASLTPNLAARSMPGGGAYVQMSLCLIINKDLKNAVYISETQLNYTGTGGDNFYGTEVFFEALANGTNLPTIRQGLAFYHDGVCYIALTRGTSGSPTTESIVAASNVLGLTYDPITGTLTGHVGGAIGSISLTNWGPISSLTLAVVGSSGFGINVSAGTDTASSFFAGVNAPQLTLAPSGANVVLVWPTNAIGFSLQSTTNLNSPDWINVSGQFAVTNPISGMQRFFRLSQ